MPAGNFSAFKVTAQVDVATMMPNWPRFVLHIIKPAVPKDTLYFESTAPYRLLKQEGPIFIGGPEVTTVARPFLHCWSAAGLHGRCRTCILIDRETITVTNKQPF